MNRSWWYDAMAYIRTIPGTVYEDQMYELIKGTYGITDINEDLELIDWIRLNAPTEELKQRTFLKIDHSTGGIYTIPSQRKYLDPLINEMCGFKFNRHLYLDNYCADILPSDAEIYDFTNGLTNEKTKKLFREEDGRLYIFFPENCIIRNFSLNDAIANTKAKSIGYIVAEGVIFEGKTDFSFEGDLRDCPSVMGGLFFDRSTFTDDFEMRNISVNFSRTIHSANDKSYSTNKIDFRNTRFFGRAIFRDISFSGETADTEISFEDSRISSGISFINVIFDHTKLNLFQTVFGRFIDNPDCNSNEPTICSVKSRNHFKLINVSFSEDSIIDMSDSEICYGEITLRNISPLPTAKLCLSPIVYSSNIHECPDCILLIENCENTQTQYISNVSELSFNNTRNYGKIIDDDNWGIFPKIYRTKTRGIFGTSIGGTKISNNLLIAVYNYANITNNPDINRNKSNDFIMLKENFSSLGLYDDEDDAFILYMEFKSYNIWYRQNKNNKKKLKNSRHRNSKAYSILYRLLYDTGKYGISPGRVVSAVTILVFFFTIVYFIFACLLGTKAFSIGNTFYGQFMYDANMVSQANRLSLSTLLISFLYSLESVVPFVSQFEPINIGVCVFTAIENAIGSFLVGYFSVAVIRKTLR